MSKKSVKDLLLKKEVQEENKEETKKDFLEDLQRLQAEFENYIKRVEKEKEKEKIKAKAGLLLKLIQIKEDLEKGLEHVKDEGIKMILEQLNKVLNEEEVREIEALGKEFDHNLHEVVKKIEGEEEKILEVIQKGYWLGDKILRASKVIIGGKNGRRN